MIRKALLSGLSVLGAAALSAGVGIAVMPAHATDPLTGVTYAPSALPSVIPTVTREDAYDSYVAAYGPDNGCREDFDANYRGLRYTADLPKGLRDDLTEQLEASKGPAIADYGDGAVVTLVNDPSRVVILGAYGGECGN